LEVPGGLSDRRYAENAADKGSFGSTWKPIRVSYLMFDSNGQERLAVDMPGGGLSCLVLNKRAKSALEPFLKQYGELLVLQCDTEPLWMLNVTKVVDALDHDKSDITEKHKYPRETPLLYRPVFIEDRLRGIDIFRLPYRNIATTYFSENFVALVNAKKITGLAARLVWSSQPE
jgi:hypothetical protein